ncbi:MAG TPA: PhzF family phenazine biosynthesis protein, partial [Vicinamibacteria bacterium]|nr:PhzF family phenazine biosynthesis protein [Vicinamibacteria bacterium]
WIELNFPAVLEESASVEPGLLEALGIGEARYVGRNRFDHLIQIDSAAEVRSLAPDYAALRKYGGRGVMVTARDDAGDYDFISRFFAPAAGINEDPVTGSAHCSLIPFWAERLGRNPLSALQRSVRGGELHCELKGDRVLIGGRVVPYLKGEISV